MPNLPVSLALTNIADGALAVAADERNNFASIQTAVNALITALSGGTANQVLQALSASSVGYTTLPLIWQGSIASAATISPGASGYYQLTGTTTVNTITGFAGGVVTLQASGQAAGVPVVIANQVGNIILRDSLALGLYANLRGGLVYESVTLAYNGSNWVEVGRSVDGVLAYTEFTADVSQTATTAATANTVVTANAITFDGGTPMRIEFGCFRLDPNVAGAGSINIELYEDGSAIGAISSVVNNAAATLGVPMQAARRRTPSNASHTYSYRAWGNATGGTVRAGAGGSGVGMPGYIKILRDV